MNYRHAYHAGNFADLAKHAILLQLLARLGGRGPLRVLDTHAGAGVYDLGGEAARRSGEADRGIARLMAADDAPPGFAPLIDAVTARNPSGSLRWYPGSPALIVGALRPRDRYLGCELRPDDHVVLSREVAEIGTSRRIEARTLQRDGFGEVAAFVRDEAPGLVLIDPPYERPDDYERAASAVDGLDRRPGLCAAVWTPLKDMETFDAFLRSLEARRLSRVVVAQVRLRPLADPMRMNGCAMVLVNAPDISGEASVICDWIAAALGEIGGRGEVFSL